MTMPEPTVVADLDQVELRLPDGLLTNSQARVAADECREAHEILVLPHPDPGYLHKLYMARIRRDALATEGRTPSAPSKAAKRRWQSPKTIETAQTRLDKARKKSDEAAAGVQAVEAEIAAFDVLKGQIDAAAETQAAAARRKLSTAKGLATKNRKGALDVLNTTLQSTTEHLLIGLRNTTNTWLSTNPSNSWAKIDALRADYTEAGATARSAYDVCIEAADEAVAEAEAILARTLESIESERVVTINKLTREHEALPKKLQRVQSILAKRLANQESAERQAKSFGIEID